MRVLALIRRGEELTAKQRELVERLGEIEWREIKAGLTPVDEAAYGLRVAREARRNGTSLVFASPMIPAIAEAAKEWGRLRAEDQAMADALDTDPADDSPGFQVWWLQGDRLVSLGGAVMMR